MKNSDSQKLDTIIAMLGDVVEVFGKRFDRLEETMATKTDIVRVHEQVNSIEQQLKLGRYEARLGNLETKVFGAPRRWPVASHVSSINSLAPIPRRPAAASRVCGFAAAPKWASENTRGARP